MSTIVALSFLLAFTQSLFGVGLLMLGTPLLLALGFDFIEVQNALLPASVFLSLLQCWDLRFEGSTRASRRIVLLAALPALALGIFLSAQFSAGMYLRPLVTAMLGFGILLRLSGEGPRERIRCLFARFETPTLFLTGLVHGLSNMGGPLLVTLAAGRYRSPRAYLALVSFAYALMASTQLLGLALKAQLELDPLQVLAQCAAVYAAKLMVSATLKALATRPLYQQLLTGLMALNLIALTLR